jgi:hypothetical protein
MKFIWYGEKDRNDWLKKNLDFILLNTYSKFFDKIFINKQNIYLLSSLGEVVLDFVLESYTIQIKNLEQFFWYNVHSNASIHSLQSFT